MDQKAEPVTVRADAAAGADVLDDAAAARLVDHLDGLADQGQTALRLDLSGVKFMDSGCLGRLIALARRLELAGGGLCLAGARGQVRQLLDMTGLGGFFGLGD